MKRLVTIILCLCALSASAAAQDNFSDESALISLNVLVADNAGFLGSSQTYIKDKMMQVIMQNGLGAASYNSRFVLTASVMPAAKDIVAGPPMQVSQTLDYTFYIVDNYDRKVFTTAMVTSKVVEGSEEKGLLKSIRSINPKNKALVTMVEDGREKIIQYYNSQIDLIIGNARMLAQTRNYEEAFFVLGAVPQACREAYAKAVAAASEIFKEYVNYMGEKNLAKAKSAWAAQQNSMGAAIAGEYLSEILPDAACYSRAEALHKEIKAKVLEDWHFEMKKYNDSVSLEKQRIEAWKQVGIAYGNHQQPTTISWLFP